MSANELPRLHLDITAICGRRAVAPLTYLIAGVGLFFSAFEFEIVLPASGPLDALVIAATATAATLLTLLLADRTVLRGRVDHRLPIALVLGVYVACGVVRAVVASLSATAVDATSPELAARSLGGIVLVVAWLSIIAIVLDYVDRDRTTTAWLQERVIQLRLQRRYYGEALSRGRGNIAALVDSVVGPAIEDSAALLAQVEMPRSRGLVVDLSGENAELAKQLSVLALQIRDQAEGQVRSLSHMLQRSEDSLSDVAVVAPDSVGIRPTRRPWFARTLKQATVLAPIQPTAVMLTVLVEIIPILTYLYGFRGLVQVAVIGSAVVFGFLVAARRLLTPRLRHWSQAMRVLALAAIAVGAGLLGTASVFLWYTPEGSELAATSLRCILVFTVAIVAWALVASSAEQSIRNQRELAAVIAEIEWETAALREELAQVERSAGEIVHGRVQGKIIAAALGISLESRRLAKEGSEDGRTRKETSTALAVAAQLLREARDDVRLIQEEDYARHASGIGDLLVSLEGAWRGVVRVTHTADTETVQLVDESDVLRARVSEAIREAVANAARHGAARSIHIEILSGPVKAPQDSKLIIRAVDDGMGPRGDIEPGLGLGQVADASGEWTLREAAGGGAELTVVFPISVPMRSERVTD